MPNERVSMLKLKQLISLQARNLILAPQPGGERETLGNAILATA